MTLRSIRSSLARLAALAAAGAGLALVAGCQWSRANFPQTTLEPTSSFGRDIDSILHAQVFWVVVIFVLVQSLVLIAVLRFRARPGAPEPRHVHGNTALEIAWTIAPAVVLALVAVPTVQVIFRTQAQPPANSLQVKVIGHQWWWEFQYPDLGVTTASELHVPVGKDVSFALESADVIHSFWFPAMGGKRDVIPSHTNHLFFRPDSVGVFMGQCAELCGLSHANMRMKMFVDTPEAFDRWVAAQKQPAATPDSVAEALAFQGMQTFNSQACIGCHSIAGNPSSVGIVGPNLTHVASRTAIAGAIYENNGANLAKWISDAPSRKPGSIMPKMDLTADQVRAIVAYLQTLK